MTIVWTSQVASNISNCDVFFCHIYFVWRFGAVIWQTSKKSRWRRCSRQPVRIYYSICSNGLQSYPYSITIALRTDRSFVWHQDLGLKIVKIILILICLPCTNSITSNFNGFIFFKNSCLLFNLDWFFKVRTNPGFF